MVMDEKSKYSLHKFPKFDWLTIIALPLSDNDWLFLCVFCVVFLFFFVVFFVCVFFFLFFFSINLRSMLSCYCCVKIHILITLFSLKYKTAI